MELVRHANAAELLAHAEPWLLAAEAENNLILGVARRYSHADPGPNAYWASLRRGSEVVGCVFRTPPHPVAVTPMPIDAVALVVSDLRRVYPSLPGVNGPQQSAERFAEQWCALDGSAWHVRMRQRVHVLTEVRALRDVAAGELRPPQEFEAPLVRDWVAGFVRDTGIVGDASELADRLLQSGRPYVWDDHGARCMVAAARDTPSGACVNAVYTPPENRRRGYATAAVATLSRRLLEAGKTFCCLYTDVANPTSNAIYKRIGYEPIREDVEIVFGSQNFPG